MRHCEYSIFTETCAVDVDVLKWEHFSGFCLRFDDKQYHALLCNLKKKEAKSRIEKGREE
jgi:hypothetical protein